MEVANSLDVCARSLQFLSWSKDQWDCKIVDHYIAFSLQLENCASVPEYPTIFEWVSNRFWVGIRPFLSGYPTFYWVGIQPFLSGYGTKCFWTLIVTKVHTHPQNLTWFTKLFLMRGWGLARDDAWTTNQHTSNNNYLWEVRVSWLHWTLSDHAPGTPDGGLGHTSSHHLPLVLGRCCWPLHL